MHSKDLSAPPRWTALPLIALIFWSVLLLTGPAMNVTTADWLAVTNDRALRSALRLSLITSLLSTCLAIAIGIPTAYRISRSKRRTRSLIESCVDIPLVLPPLVVGVCLLLLFRQGPFRFLDDTFGITFAQPAIIIAQTTIAAALATRMATAIFDRIPQRREHIARSLGATSTTALIRVILPEARSGLVATALLVWARTFGEFGPILLFAGVTRFQTEVISTAIHLELSSGHLGVASALSLLMVIVSAGVILCVSRLTTQRTDRT